LLLLVVLMLLFSVFWLIVVYYWVDCSGFVLLVQMLLLLLLVQQLFVVLLMLLLLFQPLLLLSSLGNGTVRVKMTKNDVLPLRPIVSKNRGVLKNPNVSKNDVEKNRNWYWFLCKSPASHEQKLMIWLLKRNRDQCHLFKNYFYVT
jgi:hypothetical protein